MKNTRETSKERESVSPNTLRSAIVSQAVIQLPLRASTSWRSTVAARSSNSLSEST